MEHKGNGALDSKIATSNVETASDLQEDDTMVKTTIIKPLNANDPSDNETEVKINQIIDSKSENPEDTNMFSDLNTNDVQCTSEESLSKYSAVKDNNNTIKEENPKQDIKAESALAESIEATNSKEQNQTSPVSNSSRREKCKYGEKCYRKNLQHKEIFSHPGDVDYEIPDDREECPYGTKCYRKSLLHRSQFKHTRLHPRRKCAQNGSRAKKPRHDDSVLNDLFDDESEEESIDESEYTPTESEDSCWEDELSELEDESSG